MKRKLLFAGTLLLIAWAFNSCEILNDCKTCRQVTYINGAYDHQSDATEYCGAALIAVEAQDDFISGDERTVWDCD